MTVNTDIGMKILIMSTLLKLNLYQYFLCSVSKAFMSLSGKTNCIRLHKNVLLYDALESDIIGNLKRMEPNKSIDRKYHDLTAYGEDPFKRKISIFEINNLLSYMPQENTGLISLILLKCCANYLPWVSRKIKQEIINSIMDSNKKNGKVMTQEHFKVLLQCHTKNRLHLNVDKFFLKLKSAQIPVTKEILNDILQCLCVNGQVNDAVKVFSKLKDSQVQVQENHYSDLIYMHTSLKNLKEVLNLVEQMKSLNVPIGNLTYESILKALATYEDSSYFTKFYSYVKGNTQFSVDACKTIIQELTNHQQFDLIQQFCKDQNLNSSKFFIELLSELDWDSDSKKALDLLETIQKINVTHFYSIQKKFIYRLCISDLPVQQIITMLESFGRKVSDYGLIDILLFFIIKKKNFEELKQVLEVRKKFNQKISSHCFFPIIKNQYNLKGETGLWEALSLTKGFELSWRTKLMNFLVPYVPMNNFNVKKVCILTRSNISITTITFALYFTKMGNFGAALYLLESNSKNRLNVIPKLWLEHIAKGVLRVSSTDCMIGILQYINPVYVDYLLLESLRLKNTYDLGSPNKFCKVLESLLKCNSNITQKTYVYLKKNLPDDYLTPYIKRLLRDLVADNKNPSYYMSFSLDEYLPYEQIPQIKSQTHAETLIQSYINIKIAAYTKEFTEATEAKNFILSIPNVSDKPEAVLSLILYYSLVNDVEESMKYFKIFTEKHSHFTFASFILIEYCISLAKKGLHEEVFSAISTYFALGNSMPCYTITRLLETVSTDLELLKKYKKVFDRKVQWTKEGLRPLVKSLVQKGLLEEATREYVNLCKENKIAVYFIPLVGLAFEKENKQVLDEIMKCTVEIIGTEEAEAGLILAAAELESLKNKSNPRFEVIYEKMNDPDVYDKVRNSCKDSIMKNYGFRLIPIFFALHSLNNPHKMEILGFVFKYFDVNSDKEGAKNFIKKLEEKKIKVPQSYLEKMNNFINSVPSKNSSVLRSISS